MGIVVTGRGKVIGAPDVAALTLGVTVHADTARNAATQAADTATALMEALLGRGVRPEDVQTADYSIGQEFRHTDGGSIPDGFRVSNTVVARIRILAELGPILDAAVNVASDHISIHGISFSLDDDAAALHSAREEAYVDALAKATQFADLAGRRLGAVESIVHSDSPTGIVARQRMAAMSDGMGASTPISPGEVESTATVEVHWAFAAED